MQTVMMPDSPDLLELGPDAPAALEAENAQLRQQIAELQTALSAGIADLLPLQPHQRQGQWRRTINRLCAVAGLPRAYVIGRDQADHPRRERQRAQAVGGGA
jgi:hypothetical protein